MRVTSVSMSPTLSAGDHIVIDKFSRALATTCRSGSWWCSASPRAETLAVKRVVALGGQTVALEDGVLQVDGIPQPEPELDHRGVDSVYFGPVTVPVGSVFVLGDNRGESIDSRAYGAIPVDDLVGRVTLRL